MQSLAAVPRCRVVESAMVVAMACGRSDSASVLPLLLLLRYTMQDKTDLLVNQLPTFNPGKVGPRQ